MKEPFDNFFKNCFWKRIEYHPEDNAHEYERSQAKSDCLSDNSPIVAEDKQFAFAVDLKKKKQQNAEESTTRDEFEFFKSKIQASTL